MLNPMVIFLIAAAYEKVFLNDFYYNFCLVFYFFLKKTLAVAIKNITIGFSMKNYPISCLEISPWAYFRVVTVKPPFFDR